MSFSRITLNTAPQMIGTPQTTKGTAIAISNPLKSMETKRQTVPARIRTRSVFCTLIVSEIIPVVSPYTLMGYSINTLSGYDS